MTVATTSSARACLLLLLLLLGSPSAAQEPAPLAGWQRKARPLPSGLAPIELKVEPPSRLTKQTVPLAARADWAAWAKLLADRRGQEAQRVSVVRPPGPGQALRGAWEDALERLLQGPPELLAAHRAVVDPLARELLALTQTKRGRGAAWRAVLEQYPASSLAAGAARRLGERELERGALAVAQLWWRLGTKLGGAPLPRRKLWLELRPGARDTETGIGAPAPALRLAWQRRTPLPAPVERAPSARLVASDPDTVYLLGPRHLLALEAETGLLRWRRARPSVLALKGLLRAPAQLLVWESARLSAHAPEDGRPRWTIDAASLLGIAADPRHTITDVVSGSRGALALVRTGDAWCVVAVDRAGKVAWRTLLWSCRSEASTRNAAVIAGKVRFGTTRAVIDDGRLAPLADRLFVTADGLVACLGVARGELRWLRERMVGLGLAGRLAVRVRLTADAWGVTALTSAGVLARLDPLDGAGLPLPSTPSAPNTPLLLCARPLVLGRSTGTALVVGARGRALGTVPAPLWPGAALGDRLALPLPDGLHTLDLTRPGPALVIPWPLGPARIEASARRLLLVNHAGIAALTAGPVPAAAPPLNDPLSVLPQSLGHRDHRVRARTRALLLERLLSDPSFGPRAKTQVEGASLEARVAVGEALRLAARHTRWRTIAPKAAAALRTRVIQSGGVAAIRALRPHLGQSPAVARALLQEQTHLAGTAARMAAFDLLLAVDVPAQGRLVALVTTSKHPGAKRSACDALVRLARAGGSTRPLEILVRRGFKQRDLTVFFALKAAGDAALFEKVKPRGMKQTLQSLRLVSGAARLGPPDTAALLAELEPWIRSRVR